LPETDCFTHASSIGLSYAQTRVARALCDARFGDFANNVVCIISAMEILVTILQLAA